MQVKAAEPRRAGSARRMNLKVTSALDVDVANMGIEVFLSSTCRSAQVAGIFVSLRLKLEFVSLVFE